MKERGIIFGAPMVRALLAGTKTQTRRIVKLRDGESVDGISGAPNPPLRAFVSTDAQPTAFRQIVCPYGVAGDRLWVRETWAVPPGSESPGDVAYRADIPADAESDERWARRQCVEKARWSSSIFMPRWASRITLEITDVRVERLQAISEEDAKAEGVQASRTDEDCWSDGTYRSAYEYLWGEINGWDGQPGAKAPWPTNPFVWVLTFKRC